MQTMIRRTWMWCALGLALATVGVAAAETLRIVPIVHDDKVLVSFELADAYTTEVHEAISSGLRTTFTYEVELRMMVPVWLDRTMVTSIVTISDQYDNLTRRHTLSRTVDGHVEQAVVTEDEALVRRWLTSVERLELCQTSRIDPNRDYYVRISARAHPQGAGFLGWAAGVTGQATFTFVP
jgi:hypothetical protein